MKAILYPFNCIYDFLTFIFALFCLCMMEITNDIKSYFQGKPRHGSFISGVQGSVAYEQYESLCEKAGIDKKYND